MWIKIEKTDVVSYQFFVQVFHPGCEREITNVLGGFCIKNALEVGENSYVDVVKYSGLGYMNVEFVQLGFMKIFAENQESILCTDLLFPYHYALFNKNVFDMFDRGLTYGKTKGE